MKLTEDGHYVGPHDPVYEIRYHWYNAETSIAEPERVEAWGTKNTIWLHRSNCLVQCQIVNYKNKFYPLEDIPGTVKMIAHHDKA